MKVWNVELDCDHELLVAAETPRQALDLAEEWLRREHRGAMPEKTATEVELLPGVLVIYPGPWSRDAAGDEVG